MVSHNKTLLLGDLKALLSLKDGVAGSWLMRQPVYGFNKLQNACAHQTPAFSLQP
jgi:hypothetical protein